MGISCIVYYIDLNRLQCVHVMMSFQDAIPVVDFQGVLDTEDLHKCPQVLELHTAFSQIGFVYLQNHGIKMDVVSSIIIFIL